MSDIETMIDQIAAGKNSAANATFNDIMADRISAALDNEKQAVATAIYGDPDDEEEEFEDEDLDEDDEDLEDEEEEFEEE